MCVRLHSLCLFVFSHYKSGTYERLFMPWNIKGNGYLRLYLRFFCSCNFEFTVSHNLIKSELQDVNFQFQYRSPNCEIKKVTNMVFTCLFCHGNSLHSNQTTCMLYFLVDHHPQPTPPTHTLKRNFNQGSN